MGATRLSAPVRLRANAKVNLFLRVLGRRRDGYHDVETILHGIGLFDELDVSPAPELSLEVRAAARLPGELPDLRDNLVLEAAALLRDRPALGARIVLTKGVPLGAGLGGGSADAAATLVALDRLWHGGRRGASLLELAARLGSDVPFFLAGGSALATGRGERVRPVPAPGALWFVLGLSRAPLSTADVYAVFDELGDREGPSPAPMAEALASGDPARIGGLVHNDLEPAAIALRPELRDKKEVLLADGLLGAGVSGSGPSLFGVAADETAARASGRRLQSLFDAVVVTSSRSRAVELE